MSEKADPLALFLSPPSVSQTLDRIKTLICLLLAVGVVKVIQAVGLIIILATEDESDCDAPLKEWSIIWATVTGCIACFFIPPCLICKRQVSAELPYRDAYFMTIVITIIFSLVWGSMGSIWFFTDDECQDDFEELWYAVLIFLMIDYVFAASVLVYICAVCYCKKPS